MTQINSPEADRVIAAQRADNDALARSVSVPDQRAARLGTSRPRTDKVIEHDRNPAARQPGYPVREDRFGVFRTLDSKLTAAGDAMARSNRFPQPSPRAGLEQATQAHPAGKALAGV